MSRPKLVLGWVAALAVPVAFGVWKVPAAQAQSVTPKFEAATVKLRRSGTPLHIYECSGDRFLFSGPVLADLLLWVYDLRGDANREFFRSVPSSVGSEYYDIEAKAPGPIGPETQCRLMVGALLADRFQMKIHWEERQADVSDLVVLRNGPKMQKALPTDGGPDVDITIDGRPSIPWVPPAEREERSRNKGMTMEEFASHLATTAPVPVADKTGLAGRYKIDLHYSVRLPNAQDAIVDPPLDAALAKLGLRLEKHKGAVPVPVLDHIEGPS